MGNTSASRTALALSWRCYRSAWETTSISASNTSMASSARRSVKCTTLRNGIGPSSFPYTRAHEAEEEKVCQRGQGPKKFNHEED